MTPEATIAVHDRQLDDLEKWKEKHEREDDMLHTSLGTDVSKLVTGFSTLNATLEPIIKAYWGEDSSKLTNKTPTTSKRKVSPEIRQGSIIAGLFTVVIALAEVVKALIHPAPPPPPAPSQIAAEVAKLISAAKQAP